MDPLRQSIDLSRLVIAKEFFSSPAKTSSQRSPRALAAQDNQTTDHVNMVSVGGHLAAIKAELPAPPPDTEPPSPQPGGWPLRLSNIANRLTPSPDKKLGGSLQFMEQSPHSVSPRLSAFLQESPALFSEPREAAGRPNGGVDSGLAKEGVRGSAMRTLRFGGVDASSCVSAALQEEDVNGQKPEELTLADNDFARWKSMQGNERALQAVPTNLTPAIRTQAIRAQARNPSVRNDVERASAQAGLLPAPPKRTPPALRKSRTRNPFSPGENLAQPVGGNAHKTPVGWVGFDEARAENDENRQRAWASGVRNVVGLQIRTVVRGGEGGSPTGSSKSPLACFGGARLELPKRSPIKSRAVLKSPLGKSDVSTLGKSDVSTLGKSDVSSWKEGSTRPAAPTREPFQQMSENAASKGGSTVNGGEKRVRFELEVPKKLLSPGKPSTLGRPSPLGKSCLPSPTKPLTSAVTSREAPGGQAAADESPRVLHVSLSEALPSAEPEKRPTERDGAFAQKGVNTPGRSETVVTEPIHSAKRSELGVDVLPKPGPRFEDYEFRAGLAALRKLKVESEQGLGKGAREPADEVPPWGARRSVSGSLTGSFDTGKDLPGGTVVQDLKVSVEDGGKEELVLKEVGKKKWDFGFGRSGKKVPSGKMAQVENVGLEQKVKEISETGNKEKGKESNEVLRGEEEGLRSDQDGVRLGAAEIAKAEKAGKKIESANGVKARDGKQKRKGKEGASEKGAEAVRPESTSSAKAVNQEHSQPKDVSEGDDVSKAPEKRAKKGLLRKALRLKRSKAEKRDKEEAVEAAEEGVTHGEQGVVEEDGAARSCHVAEEARARDTPVKITLEGVKIVVRPKDAGDDVSTPGGGEDARQVHVGTPAGVTSAAGAQLQAAHSVPLPVPTTDDKMRLLAAALERAAQTSKPSPHTATTPTRTAPPTSPRFSPQLLSVCGRSPVGSAERLEEVRQRMEARVRVLGDQARAPRAVRRLRMDGAVAANGEREGVSGGSVASEEGVVERNIATGAGETERERDGASQQNVTGDKAENDNECTGEGVTSDETTAALEAVKRDATAEQTKEAHGVEDGKGDGVPNPGAAAETVAAAGALKSQTPPPDALTGAAIVPGAEDSMAAQKPDNDGEATPATKADGVLTPAPKADVMVTSALKADVTVTSADVSPADGSSDDQREPASPVDPFVGAAAFFRGAKSRPLLPAGRRLSLGPVGSTGHEKRSAASPRAENGTCKEEDGRPKGDSTQGSRGKESACGVSENEGDLLPVTEPSGSPAGSGDKLGANGAEGSSEQTFRGAAAFFSRANGTPSKVRTSSALAAAFLEADSPGTGRLPAARSAAGGQNSIPVNATAPPVSVRPESEQNATPVKPCASRTPPEWNGNNGEGCKDEKKVGGSVVPPLQGGAVAAAREGSPEERVPNAAAFFGRRAAASPVAPRVLLPLQELKGFENRPTEDGPRKKSGSKEGKAKDGASPLEPVPGMSTPELQAAEQTHRAKTAKETLLAPLVGPSVPVPVVTPSNSRAEASGGIRDVTTPVADVSPNVTGPERRQDTISETCARSTDRQHSLRTGVPVEPVSRSPEPDSEAKVLVLPRESGAKGVEAVSGKASEKSEEGLKRGTVLEMVRRREVAERGDTATRAAHEPRSFSKAPSRRPAPDAAASPTAADAASIPQMDALMRENERLKAQVVLLQEEKHRIAKQMEASSLKASGNSAFARGNFEDAKRAYNRALELRVNDNQFNAVIYTNRAAANLALGATMDALADCAAALHVDPKCAGAVLRKVDACLAIGDWQTALSDLSALEKAGSGTDDVRRKAHDLKAKMWRAPAQLDFYGILELTPRSNLTAVKNAYKRLALRYHPDRAGAHADLVFQYVARAYQVLSNPVDKKKYDAQLQRALK